MVATTAAGCPLLSSSARYYIFVHWSHHFMALWICLTIDSIRACCRTTCFGSDKIVQKIVLCIACAKEGSRTMFVSVVCLRVANMRVATWESNLQCVQCGNTHLHLHITPYHTYHTHLPILFSSFFSVAFFCLHEFCIVHSTANWPSTPLQMMYYVCVFAGKKLCINLCVLSK